MNEELSQAPITQKEAVASKIKEIFPFDKDGYYNPTSMLHRFESADYECKDNETDIQPPSFYKARWTGDEWVEDGKPPEPIQHIPTQGERIDAIENALLEIMMGGNA